MLWLGGVLGMVVEWVVVSVGFVVFLVLIFG